MSDTEHAGRRDTRVSFERLKSDTAVDASGHVDETDPENWRPFASRWAEVYTKGSREFFRGQQIAAEATHKVKVRWDRELSGYLSVPNASKFRIRIGSRALNLSGPPINEDEQDEYISFP